MKDYLKTLTNVVNDFRSGDRIFVDSGVKVKTLVYRRSKQDEPYLNVEYRGGFKITLLELIIIVAAASVTVTIIALWMKKKMVSVFKRKKDKR
ncbi:MAG: hypothetical protein IKT70_09350 [Clostridia bacterium]|nr:hypothetical protein [Clostridia bacterium]